MKKVQRKEVRDHSARRPELGQKKKEITYARTHTSQKTKGEAAKENDTIHSSPTTFPFFKRNIFVAESDSDL